MDDLEQQVVRIVETFNRHYGRGPTYDELLDRTGHGRRELEAALRDLQMSGRIHWDGRGPETAIFMGQKWGKN